jgi:serine/threonine-protein kinase RsbW
MRHEHDGQFVDEVMSAVGEAFNNIAIHAYRDTTGGDVELEMAADEHAITIRMSDTGRTFDPATVPDPDLSALPERSLGLYIIRSFMDDVRYVAGSGPGRPNVLMLRKRFPRFRYREGDPPL